MNIYRIHLIIQLILLLSLWLHPQSGDNIIHLPYAQAGLTERQAAAHLLNRFAFGGRSDQIDTVVEMGLENWLGRQLSTDFSDQDLENDLTSHFDYLSLSNEEIVKRYPNNGRVLRMAIADGALDHDDREKMNQEDLRRLLRQYAEDRGFRPVRQLIGQMMANKLTRAVYSANQLQEVLVDFWFNHFNVSITDNQARIAVPTYERDAIRPHVLGNFRDMLGATAKHPAMLLYLDNAQSSAADSTSTTMSMEMDRQRNQPGLRGMIARRRVKKAEERMRQEQQARMENVPEQLRRRRGINENYARELMELHTLGVDGGYTQADVEAVSRAFTGWSVFPDGEGGERMQKRLERGRAAGFIRDDYFLFRADRHDAAEKYILGEVFPAGAGMEEGERVLDILSTHPSTAQHIARKMAVRFVSDTPPQDFVYMLAQTFLETNGDLKQMALAIAESPAFWHQESLGAKIKSPFEVAASALRLLDAKVRHPREMIQWIRRMGQPLYAYQAPTGYPDRADAWVNSGALLNRMNFGLRLATGNIRGVRVDILALNQNREPASLESALSVFAALLLPERDLSETITALLPVIHDPQFAKKVASVNKATEDATGLDEELSLDDDFENNDKAFNTQSEIGVTASSLAQVVGIILGSPEFQRR